jgi:hypothetical protein
MSMAPSLDQSAPTPIANDPGCCLEHPPERIGNVPVPVFERPNGRGKHCAGCHGLPFRLRTPSGTLSFISTVTVFGTALEITLSELTMETFYPADEFTKTALSGLG